MILILDFSCLQGVNGILNILFLTLYDFNDINDRNIYPDLLRRFVQGGHNVYIVSPNERKKRQGTKIIDFQNCIILKVKTLNIIKANILEKGISTILIELQFKLAIKKHFSNIKFDCILYSTPPITFAKVIDYIKKRDAAQSYLLLKDIFPQNAVDLGMFSSKSIFYKFFRAKEKKLYRLSDFIGCMSQANVDYLLKHNPYIDKEKAHVLPNSIEPVSFVKDEEIKNAIRKKWGLPLNTKIFIYGGNLGKPQDISFVIQCLKQNQNKEDRFFIICGTGTEYAKLESYIQENKPENIRLINGLPKKEYEQMVFVCDVGLIYLDHRFTIPNFPSRLLSYMEYGMPVIACTDPNTDIGKTIVDGDFGWWCESDMAEHFTEVVDIVCNEEIQAIKDKGNNSSNYLMNNYTAERSYKVIMERIRIL